METTTHHESMILYRTTFPKSRKKVTHRDIVSLHHKGVLAMMQNPTFNGVATSCHQLEAPDLNVLAETDTSSSVLQESSELEVTDVSVKFSLPVVMFTYSFLELCKEHELARLPILLALSMLGNMNTNRWFIHKFKVVDKASELGCTPQQVYSAVRQLRETGFGHFKLRHGTVSGRLMGDMVASRVLHKYEETGELTDEDLCGHSMPVGMLHHLQIETHIKARTTGAHLRLMLACCLNIDVQTGELHEKRPCEWADLAGMHRTWAVAGFAHANEIGAIQTKTDYDVTGRFPFVALANGVFANIRLAKEEGRDTKDRVKERIVALYECFGIDLGGLAHEIIENAWRLLGDQVDKLRRDGLKKLAGVLGREAPRSERRRVFEEWAGDTIPLREDLPFAELPAGIV